jgi:hypothetical protein
MPIPKIVLFVLRHFDHVELVVRREMYLITNRILSTERFEITYGSPAGYGLRFVTSQIGSGSNSNGKAVSGPRWSKL